jgi:biopolymer transport protein ExbD
MDSISFEETPELNITPLVDIMLVLLAILMVTTPVIIYEEKIQLPKGSKSAAVSKIPQVDIGVLKNKTITYKKNKYTFKDFVDNFSLQTQAIKKITPVFLKADQSLKYKDVMYVLKAIKEVGFSRVSLVTQ